LSRRVQIAPRNGLAFIANPMHSNNAATFHEEPDDPAIEFEGNTNIDV
jgi:hypothetical protein